MNEGRVSGVLTTRSNAKSQEGFRKDRKSSYEPLSASDPDVLKRVVTLEENIEQLRKENTEISERLLQVEMKVFVNI
ncbi:hypothetical protein SERLA73DRAFT_142906, partial [Serpula lacrymans var. lacrymans S7.3]